MAKLAVIADDLTGANDTAVQFAKRGIGTCVQIDFQQRLLERQENEVIVLNTDSRDMSATQAYDTVRHAASVLKAQGIEHIYKKVDSTLRGNFAAEIAAVEDVFQPSIVVIAPAFPKNHRITIGGYHFLEGLPIEMTEIAYAPKTPVHDSSIGRLIEQQTGRSAGLISLQLMKQGVDAIQSRLAAYLVQGVRWIVFDVAAEEHFELILKATAEYKQVLWAGSAGLANYLPERYGWKSHAVCEAVPMEGATLVVAGSVSHTTQAQIMELLRQPDVRLVKLDVQAVFESATREAERCRQAVRQGLQDQQNVLLVSSLEDRDVRQAVQTGSRYGLQQQEVSERMAWFMAEVVHGLDMSELAGMVLTGGDIAVHVLRRLSAESIEVVAEVAVGIPLGRLRGGRCSGMLVVTKAGAFGDADCFVKALHVIRGV